MVTRDAARLAGDSLTAITQANERRLWAVFVIEYLKDYSAAGAYRRTYGAHLAQRVCISRGHALLCTPEIAEEIQKYAQHRLQLADVSAERVTLELARVAFSDIGKIVQTETITGVDGKPIKVEMPRDISAMDDDTRRAVKEVTFGKHGATIKMHDKQAALETLAKLLMVAQGAGPRQGRGSKIKDLNGPSAAHDAYDEDEIAMMLADYEAGGADDPDDY